MKTNNEIISEIKPYLYRALFREITPNMRAIYLGFENNTMKVLYIFDGEISDDDQNNFSCIDTEIVADFPWYQIDEKCIRIDRTKAFIIDRDKRGVDGAYELIYRPKEELDFDNCVEIDTTKLEFYKNPFEYRIKDEICNNPKTNNEIIIEIEPYFYEALLGKITPNIRAMYLGFENNTIKILYVFDGEISDEDKNNFSCVDAEVLAYFPCYKMEEKCIRVDRPRICFPDLDRSDMDGAYRGIYCPKEELDYDNCIEINTAKLELYKAPFEYKIKGEIEVFKLQDLKLD